VHNAGVILPNPVEQAKAADIAALAQLHLAAPLSLLSAALPQMKLAGFGRVVLISSRAALGAQGRTAYSATKAGMIGMGRTWALELAPFGITVNMVAPGPIQGTHMFHEIVAASSERETALANAIPVKRLGKPEDVANAVLFFASGESSFVTGQVLYVCGGASVGTLVI
jgi:NAD(P)-dependent dehydrogenase (short-subunit alcohol dehydrogenase family)